MKKFFVQGAGTLGGASFSDLQGLICASALRNLRERTVTNAAAHSRKWATISLNVSIWLLPVAALLSVPASRHALISADLSLVLLTAAAIFLTAWFTALDWRKEGRV